MNKKQELNKAKYFFAFKEMIKSEYEEFFAVIVGESLREEPELEDYFVKTVCGDDAKKIEVTRKLLRECSDNLELYRRKIVVANMFADKCLAAKLAGKEPDREALFEETLKEYDEAD